MSSLGLEWKGFFFGSLGFLLGLFSHLLSTNPAETITDEDYADDIVLLTTAPNQAESLLHNLEQALSGTGLRENIDKTEYMCFNQERATLNGRTLKLLDKFTYWSGKGSSTESNENMHLAKAWTAIDRLLIVWMSDLSDKTGFLSSSGCINTTVRISHMDANKIYWDKTRLEVHKNATSYKERILEAASHETTSVWQLTTPL